MNEKVETQKSKINGIEKDNHSQAKITKTTARLKKLEVNWMNTYAIQM